MKSKTLFAHYTKRNLLLQYLSFLITRPKNAPLAPSRPCPRTARAPRAPWCGPVALPRVSRGAVPLRFLACPMVRSRGGRARCPHRAARAHSHPLASALVRLGDRARCLAAGPLGSRRRAIARGGSPPRCAAWQVAHAESFACRSSVRGTVRGRAAHPARYLAAGPPGSRRHYPRALPG